MKNVTKTKAISILSMLVFICCLEPVHATPGRWSFHSWRSRGKLEIYASYPVDLDQKWFEIDPYIPCQQLRGTFGESENNKEQPKDIKYKYGGKVYRGSVVRMGGSYFESPDLGAELLTLIGTQIWIAPWLADDATDELLFVGIDLDDWVLDPTSFSLGDTFNIVNGVSPDLPGMLFGTSEVTFDPNFGLVTANSFTGTGKAEATIDGGAVPEPSTILLLGTGLLGLMGVLKKRR